MSLDLINQKYMYKFLARTPEEIHSYIYKIYFKDNILEEINKLRSKTEEDFHEYSEPKLLCDLYNIITKLNIWEDIKNDNSEYLVFSQNEWIGKLSSDESFQRQGHSGSSFSWAINIMRLEAPDY